MLEITHRQKIKLKENNSSSLKRHIFSFRNEFPSAFKEQHVFPLLGITAKPRTIKQQSQRQEQRASEAGWRRLGLRSLFYNCETVAVQQRPAVLAAPLCHPQQPRATGYSVMGEVVGKWEGKDRERRQRAQWVLLAKQHLLPGLSWFGETTAGLYKLKGGEACSWHRWCTYWCSFSKHWTQHKITLQKQTRECSLTEPRWTIALKQLMKKHMLKSAVKFLHLNCFGAQRIKISALWAL